MKYEPNVIPSSATGAATRELYVVGGQQRHARSMIEQGEHWYKYNKGLILRVDPVSGCVERCVEYVSPPEVCPPDDPAILFKCGTVAGDTLYVCTQTEILMYGLPGFEVRSYISLPCFNDVHHVAPSPSGTIIVAISGLDMVVEIDRQGNILREWDTLGNTTWQKFSKDIDYRRVSSTKPHHSHPNYVFYVDGEVWATRFEQRDAICLEDRTKRISVDIERVHDGVVHNGRIYFTTVNGYIVAAEPESLRIEDVFDLNQVSHPDSILGWCRGILVDGDLAWIGFSRLRLTKFRENVSWVRQGFKSHLPTRIACYDLRARRLLTEIDVQAYGMDAAFSILPASIS